MARAATASGITDPGHNIKLARRVRLHTFFDRSRARLMARFFDGVPWDYAFGSKERQSTARSATIEGRTIDGPLVVVFSQQLLTPRATLQFRGSHLELVRGIRLHASQRGEFRQFGGECSGPGSCSFALGSGNLRDIQPEIGGLWRAMDPAGVSRARARMVDPGTRLRQQQHALSRGEQRRSRLPFFTSSRLRCRYAPLQPPHRSRGPSRSRSICRSRCEGRHALPWVTRHPGAAATGYG